MALRLLISDKSSNYSFNYDVEPDMPLLWVLRDELGITGVKYGCGIAQCGACTVHVDGQAMRSCQISIGDLEGQSGQIMQAASLLSENDNPTDEEIDDAMSGNLCRCGTYPRLRQAVKTAAKNMRGA